MLATLFFPFPFVSLIAALVLQGGQPEPRKKSQLRTSAWASRSWLLLGIVIALSAFGAFAASGSGSSGVSRSGPCRGGPDMNAAGRQIPGTHKYVFDCVFGGTETTRLP